MPFCTLACILVLMANIQQRETDMRMTHMCGSLGFIFTFSITVYSPEKRKLS